MKLYYNPGSPVIQLRNFEFISSSLTVIFAIFISMLFSKRNIYTGIGLALFAVIIWSGNFIAAKGVSEKIPPISLNFYRWLTASVFIFPLALKNFLKEWPVVKQSGKHLLVVSLSGVTLFNTFLYIGAHFTSANNLALISTTTSPIIAIVLAKIFLKEKIGWMKSAGMALCVAGVLFLLTKGKLQNLVTLSFTKGDGWIVLAAFTFAVYNTFVKKKPAGISPVNYLFVVFSLGTLILVPFYLFEINNAAPVHWNVNLVLIILYIGLGASVISFLCWNIAISNLGSGRTALFGNLIPVFSSVEAAFILNEQFTWVHSIGMLLVFSGILLANLQLLKY